jgi:hypothetical protein
MLFPASAFAGVFDDSDGCPMGREAAIPGYPINPRAPGGCLAACPPGWERLPEETWCRGPLGNIETNVAAAAQAAAARAAKVPSIDATKLAGTQAAPAQPASADGCPVGWYRDETGCHEHHPNVADIGAIVIFVGPVVLFFVFRHFRRLRREAEIAASPEHPFKVNVAVEPFKTTGFQNVLRGRALTHFLSMDVKISMKDWQRIKDAGLYDAVLFDYPNNRSTYDGTRDTFPVRILEGEGRRSVGFYNIGDAEEAKEKLLKALYDLKDAIALQKEGKRSESFEI